MSIMSVMPSNHLILCCPLLLVPSIFPHIKVFSNESVLCIKWPKYWSFSLFLLPNHIIILVTFKWSVLIYSSLMVNNDEHLFMWSPAICVSFLVRYLFSLTIFKTGSFILLNCKSSLCILASGSLSDIWFVNIFCGFSFHFLYCFFEHTEALYICLSLNQPCLPKPYKMKATYTYPVDCEPFAGTGISC